MCGKIYFLFPECVFTFFSVPTDLKISESTFPGMLDTESPAMESNGDAFLPDLPVVGQATDWSLDQVAPEPLSNVLPEDSDVSQDAMGQEQQPGQQMNSTDLGSVEKAVEQFQLANAQLFQEHPPPPPPPPPPPQPTEDEQQATEPVGSEPCSQDMNIESESIGQTDSQGNLKLVFQLAQFI